MQKAVENYKRVYSFWKKNVENLNLDVDHLINKLKDEAPSAQVAQEVTDQL